ncbi:hypothetical protein JJD26997_1711 [Campylobacter jejuni subsp. doylei 269.97]|uniref:Uncharacterized protein n=1 Tax=Campylobacter jejuni subsp. doylei (strain ATCC BAA-1458 / RM4099 / 269.97) TaxID=360109 RepID=A7H5B2_CAMJD|nr:hypothetical protein JJD26997_1711 [Campylobacter jejuni subsp. doylei 269.97]
MPSFIASFKIPQCAAVITSPFFTSPRLTFEASTVFPALKLWMRGKALKLAPIFKIFFYLACFLLILL